MARLIPAVLMVCVGFGAVRGSLADQPAVDGRPLWNDSRVVGSPEPPLPYYAEPAFPDLEAPYPIYLEHEPGSKQRMGHDQLLLVHQDRAWTGAGRILRFRNDSQVAKSQVLLETNYLIYGLTFHPDYEQNGYLFVCSNGPVDADNKHNRISRYTISRDAPYQIVEGSELVILEWESNGHNGGDLEFGPDGLLYIPTGDGTSDSDTNDTGQDLSNLFSIMIRIDVDHPDSDRPYSIPADNPFLDIEDARPEAWAFGFRNPWRLTFDARTGHLWVGNNGQDLWEQIFFVRRGENYGWSVYEGSHPFQLGRKRGPAPIAPPALEHPHSEARSLTGGVVYYGDKFPELEGVYLYGDYSTGRIWGARHDGQQVTWHRELANTTLQITGFATGPEGNIYVSDHGGGIQRLVRRPPDNHTTPFPQKLSETGLFDSVAEHHVHPALVSYSVNTPQWADGAAQQRWLALPGDSTIRVPNARTFELPEQTVLMKTLSIETQLGDENSRRRIETQLLTKQQNEWAGYTYRWNEDQTDAVLVPSGGEDVVLRVPDPQFPSGWREQQWRFASRTECMMCHSRAARFVLGFTPEQLNVSLGALGHEPAGSTGSNQLNRFESLQLFEVAWRQHRQQWFARSRRTVGELSRLIGIPRAAWSQLAEADPAAKLLAHSLSSTLPLLRSTSGPLFAAERVEQHRQGFVAARIAQWDRQFPASWLLAQRPAELPRLYNLTDADATLSRRARSYLHANCAVCHMQAGGGNSLMELTYSTSLDKMRILDVAPQHERFQMRDARLIASGDPYRSLLLYRICKAGGGRMPRVGSQVVDTQAFEVLRDWVYSLETGDEQKQVEDRSLRQLRQQQSQWLAELQSSEVDLPAENPSGTILHLLETTSGALRLWEALQAGRLPRATAERTIELTQQSPVQPVRELFEYYLPIDQRAKRLGTEVEAGEILALTGDPERGRALFVGGSGLQCRNCHRVGKDSPPATPQAPIGPDLSRLEPPQSRSQLLESILEPSKKIDAQYTAVTVETVKGKVFAGVLREQAPSHLLLQDAQNQILRFDPQDIDVIVPQQKSLMPDFLARDLTAQQLSDLLAYLVSLQE